MQEAILYRVVLSGRMRPGYDRDAVIDALADLFGSSREKMARLLQGTAVPFRKEYDREEALRIRDRIRGAGAECEIEPAPDTATGGPANQAIPEVESEGVTTAEAPDDAEAATAEPAAADDSGLMAALMAFVGPKADYYRQRFTRFGDLRQPRFAPTWHWPAFFAFFIWALYRKLWLWAGIYLAGSFLLLFFFAPLPLLLAWVVVWPLAANWLYFRQARSKVMAGDPAPEGGGQQYYPDGGVSGRAVLLGIGFVILLNSAFSQLFLSRFIEKFEQEFGDLLPESGTILRGDGSVLDPAAADSQLRRSVERVTNLSVLIRLRLATQSEQGGTLDFDRLQQELGRDKFVDGWGNPLRIRQDVEGVTINSAGPDGAFDTADDILHTIPLNRLNT